jgi:hypothetical protein
MNFPSGAAILGQGQVPTEAETNKIIRSKQATLAIQLIGQILGNGIPTVGEFKIPAVDVFEYAMEIVHQVDNYIESEPQTNLKQ